MLKTKVKWVNVTYKLIDHRNGVSRCYRCPKFHDIASRSHHDLHLKNNNKMEVYYTCNEGLIVSNFILMYIEDYYLIIVEPI